MSEHPAAAAMERVRRVCDLALQLTAGTACAAQVDSVRARLDGALRVALAGRVKAGKSTLLNALVGERLAPTDAGECTKVVTWYQHGVGYDVVAIDRDGSTTAVPFRRIDGALVFDIGSLDLDHVQRLVVSWPSSALRNLTLIDTPGLASLAAENSLRTSEFLALDDSRPSEADAVVYLMRHLHERDAEFLGAFMDRSVAGSSPINAVAVLSRADEIGAGRLDAMESARRIAGRYEANDTMRALCTAVVPVAGLIAETALTLREDEAWALRQLAATPAATLDRMLRAADAFCEPSASELTVELRRQLIDRLGMFGLRFCVTEIRSGGATSANELSAALVAESGLSAVRDLIADLFLPRANILKARVALVGLRAVAVELRTIDPAAASTLAARIEQCEASTHEFAELRLNHLVLSGLVNFDAAQREELTTLMDLDHERNTSRADVLAGVERWRIAAAQPFADVAMREACDTMAHTYERRFSDLPDR